MERAWNKVVQFLDSAKSIGLVCSEIFFVCGVDVGARLFEIRLMNPWRDHEGPLLPQSFHLLRFR